jgi:hypothetical protein
MENRMTTTPTLGMLLQAQACDTEDCVRALERQAALRGQCAEKDLQLVRAFFHDASTGFSSSILARLAPPVVEIGNGHHDKLATVLQTYRWKDDYDIRTASHPYNGVWQPFERWCADNELEAVITRHHDASGKETWFTLGVVPARHLAP